MSNFLNSISSVISFLMTQLTNITNTLISNIIFQVVVGIFLFNLVVEIISSFVHMKGRKTNIND